MLNLSRKIKSDKGSITSFTLLSMLFFLVVVIAIYASVNTKIQKQEKEIKSVQDNYKQENIDDIYGNTLNGKAGLLATYVKVGDYVSYEPDTLNEANLNTLKNNLNTYSGKSDSTINSAINRDELKWRVLDVNEKTGQVRLISAEPTSSKIELYGYNGYNNAVKLIDGACSTLYNNSKLASKVQNLKIEDITRYMTTQPTDDKSEYTLADINYPNILKQEKNQTTKESATPKLGISEQYDLVTGNSKSDTILKNTYWKQSMNADTSLKEKYYELFIKKQENYYSEYLISSRCITSSSYSAGFCIRYISSNDVTAFGLCYSSNKEYSISGALRPIITLNSNVQLDTTKAADGTQPSTAYEIK